MVRPVLIPQPQPGSTWSTRDGYHALMGGPPHVPPPPPGYPPPPADPPSPRTPAKRRVTFADSEGGPPHVPPPPPTDPPSPRTLRLDARELRRLASSQAAASSAKMASQEAELTHIGSDFSQMAFGCPDFEWVVKQEATSQGLQWSRSGNTDHWIVYCNRPQRHHRRHDERILYHATTLSQCHAICETHFDVGRYHAGSASSPCGIWGTSEPGHSVDRVPLKRGWSCDREREPSMCGWDCPVAFGWLFKKHEITSHKQLATGTVYVHKLPCGTEWNVLERYTEIWVHAGLWDRFRLLSDHWHSLVLRQSVACRSRLGCPQDLYTAGDASPMTCARVCSVSNCATQHWHIANNSEQYRCNCCDLSSTSCRPCTDQQ